MNIAKGQHLIGKVLGSCLLERLLGYGGSSAVFLAQDSQSEQKVAVKVFLPRDGQSPRMQREFYRRFLHEVEAASKLDHPNILPIYAYGEEDGLPYIVMPYMEGGTLLDYMSKRGALSLKEAQWYLEQLAAALDYAHEHGCVHCDVKPANMLLDSEGRVMLSDFGIAYLMNGTDPADNAIKASDALMGTPDYISPEQALGQHLDGCSDVYSLGVTLFFLLAKKLPFRADTPIATALLHIHEPPPSLSLLRADITPALDRVVQKALAKSPSRRFQTASAFSTAFVSALADGYEKSSLVSLKEVSLFDESLSDTFFAALSDLPVAQPVVRLLPLKSRQRLVLRSSLLLLVVCLLVLSVAGTTLVSFMGRFPPKTSVISSTQTPVSTSKDKLAYVNQWPSSQTFFFDDESQSYHVLNRSPNVVVAPYSGEEYRDFHLTVTASEVRRTPGHSGYYGIIFRESVDQFHYYLFEIAPNDGNRYLFLRYDGTWTMLHSGHLPIILKSNTPHTLSVEAHGNRFTFLVNGKPVAEPLSDPSKTPLLRGQVGLCVEDQGTEVAFSHLYIDD